MLKECGLETEVRTVSICCCQDALLDGNHLFFLLYFFKLFCLSGVAEVWRVFGCYGASVVECVVAFIRIIMSVSIYQLTNVTIQCLQYSCEPVISGLAQSPTAMQIFWNWKNHPPPRVLIWLPNWWVAGERWWKVRASAPRGFLVSWAAGGWWLVFWFSCVIRFEFGLARHVRGGPSLFGDPLLMPQMPRYVVEANCVWRGYLKFWFGCGTVPVRLWAELGRIGQPMRAPVAGRRSIFMYWVCYYFIFCI
jgi:hypothetical protein